MYEVLDKDTIKSEILPHLSVVKRGYALKSPRSFRNYSLAISHNFTPRFFTINIESNLWPLFLNSW